MYNLEKELDLAKKAAYLAGAEILKIYNTDFSVEYKADNSPLTMADTNANKIIADLLRTEFSEYAWLSEENSDNLQRLDNPWCFVIDPLDGTKEFLKKNGEFTVNIALVHNGTPVLGVIYAPCLEELYFAICGKGAYMEKNGSTKRLEVSKNTENLRLVASRSHMSEKLIKLVEKYQISAIKSIGSSLKGCLVAKGEADIYYRFGPTMEWDTAAMQCIVTEAGGIVRQMDDSPLTYNRSNSLNEKGFYILNTQKNKLDLGE